MTVCVEANFSKTAERNKTLFTGIQVRLRLSSNQKTDRKSVQSTRRYFKVKVRYQIIQFDYRVSSFAKIEHLNSIKLHIKYIWRYSPLSEESNEPIYAGLLGYFGDTNFGWPNVTQNMDFFQIDTE